MDFKKNLFFLILLAASLYVISPMFLPLSMGAIFASLFYPWQVRLQNRKVRPHTAAALITVGVTFGFLLPTVFLVYSGARLGMDQLGSLDVLKGAPLSGSGDQGGFFETLVDSVMAKPSVSSILDTIGRFFPINPSDIASGLREVARTAGAKVGSALGSLITHLPSLLLALAVMTLSQFFFLADGAKLGNFVRRFSIYSPRQTDQLILAFTGMCRSVILASLVSGFAQALIFWVTCLLVGTSNATLIGFLVFFMSFIPLIGSSPVTFLVAIHQFFVVDSFTGIVLLCVAAVVGMIDNVIRPWVLKGTGNLHPLLAFVAAFGGLQVFGVAGVFLGPVIAGVFLAVLEIVRPPAAMT